MIKKKDLETQAKLLTQYCTANGWQFETIEDLGSGMNYRKKGLKRLLELILERNIKCLVLTHKNPLLRFGNELIFVLWEAREIEVIMITLALTETDRSANLVSGASFPLTLCGKSTGQAKALTGDVAKERVDRAKKERKAIVMEKLDFQDKKRCLKDSKPKHARMLSAFSYQRTLEAIRARAHREGVEVFAVNPAYTLQIGKIKFAKRYGLSIHHAAALCITPRIAGLSELLPRHSEVPSGKGTYVAFAVPARTQQRFFWSYLRVVARKLRTALAENFRVTKCQSVGPLAPTWR